MKALAVMEAERWACFHRMRPDQEGLVELIALINAVEEKDEDPDG